LNYIINLKARETKQHLVMAEEKQNKSMLDSDSDESMGSVK